MENHWVDSQAGRKRGCELTGTKCASEKAESEKGKQIAIS
jgi:hypothetical protein